MSLQEVRGLDDGVVRRASFEGGDGRKNGGVVDKVLIRGDSKKSLLVGFREGAPLVVVVVGDDKELVGMF